MLNQDPHVQASVFFGRGRFQAGVLIEPAPGYCFDPTDTAKLAEFRNMIWCVTLLAKLRIHPLILVRIKAYYRNRQRLCTSALEALQRGLDSLMIFFLAPI